MYSAHMRRVASAPDVKGVVSVPDEKTFYNQFWNFNHRQRRHHTSYPTINGQSVNFYKLFSSVVSHGGYSNITDKNDWEIVANEIGCPSACTNYSVALRRIYCQYLVAFENELFPQLKTTSFWAQLQDELNENPGDIYVPPSVEKLLGICNPKPAAYHPGMHRSATTATFSSRDFYRANQDSRPFDQLPPAVQLDELYSMPHPENMLNLRYVTTLETAEKSLLSGMPNEIDLTLNAIYFLSAVVADTPATPIRFSSCRNLLQLMLASVGVYEDGPNSLQNMSEIWKRQGNFDFDKFWRSTVDEEILTTLSNDAFLYDEHSLPLVTDAETAGYRVVPPLSSELTQDLFVPSASNPTRMLFGSDSTDDCLSTNPSLSRVLMVVATLVNSVTGPYLTGIPTPIAEEDDELDQVMSFASVGNRRLSMSSGAICSGDIGGRPFRGRSLYPGLPPLAPWRDNARFLSSNPVALRFAFLCTYARHSALRQLGLQLIGALRYPLVPTTTFLSKIPRPLHVNTFTGIELLSLQFLVRCLIQSNDRCDLLAGLSLLTNLMRVPEGVNVERLFAGLPRSLWCRLIQLLCLSDLGLVCAVLESLYTVTGMGAIACTRLWSALASADDTVSPLAPSTVFAARRASSHLRPLLALLCLEGKDMGPESLHRVKVVPRHPNPPPVIQEQHFEQLHSPRYSLPPHHSVPTPRPSSSYPMSPQRLPIQRPQQLSPNPSLMPPQHIPPQPQSLASLLGPGGGGNRNSSSNISSGSRASVSPRMANPPSLPPLPPQVANVRPKPSSLSELTDRLVMPPPKELPPRRQSSRVNGSPGSPAKTPLVNGRVHNTPPPNSVLNHHHQYNHPPNQVVSTSSPQKPTLPSTSLLEEVLNNPASSKVVPSPKSPPSPLLNGYSNRASTIHHTGAGRKSIPTAICNPPVVKMVNGEANNTAPILPVIKNKYPEQNNNKQERLVNGISHEHKPKKLKSEYNEMKEDEEENEEETETRLMEWATFNTHQLFYNRKVGFFFTRKRPRYFAVRNRVYDQPKPTASKRRKMMLVDGGLKSFYRHVATAALLSREQGKTTDSNSSHRSNIPTAVAAAVQQTQPPSPPPLMFVCEWSGCFRQFPLASQVYSHAYSCHLKPLLPPQIASKSSSPSNPIERRCCLWNDCSTANIPRAPFSLQSHVLDTHCSTAELESRRRLIPHRTSPYRQPSSTTPVPPIYCPPDHSGWAIIQDVETRRMRSELWLSQYAVSGGRYPSGTPVAAPRDMLPPREGPVTKHLRVTAALILRNLAKYVQEAKQWLSSETPLLCEIAMGTCPGAANFRTNDAGRIIAQCLSLCSSVTSSSFPLIPRRIISGTELDEIDTYCSFGLQEAAEVRSIEEETAEMFIQQSFNDGFDETEGRLPVLQRLALMRQRVSVDLDA